MKKHALKISAILLIVVSLATALLISRKQSGSNELSADDKIAGKIVFFTNRTDKAQTTIKAIADEFMQIHPGSEIEIESVESSQIATVIGTRAAADELPDITIVLNEWSKKDWPAYFLELDNVFNKDEIYFYNDGIVNGHLYRVSTALNIGGIIYNKKAFSKAGITETPKNMEEFWQVCEKLKAAGIVPYGTNYKDKWPLEKIALDYTRIHEGDPNALNNLGEPGVPLLEEGKGMLAGWNWMRKIVKNGYAEPDLMSTNWDKFKMQHARGEIAMTFLATWYPPQVIENGIAPEDIGMFPAPGSKKILLFADWRLAISRKTKYPKTAKAFLKFLYEDGRYAKAINIIPPIKGIIYKDSYIKEILGSGLDTMEEIPDTIAYKEAYSKAQVDYSSAIQEYIVAKDTQAVIRKNNEKWLKAK